MQDIEQPHVVTWVDGISLLRAAGGLSEFPVEEFVMSLLSFPCLAQYLECMWVLIAMSVTVIGIKYPL